MTSAQLRAPVPLLATHDLDPFDCGIPELDEWLVTHALRNGTAGASWTYVVCPEASTSVVGYYSLATGGVARDAVAGAVRRNMPDPIPVIVLGRLAVDQRYQERGLGLDLLVDAVLRTLRAADIVGVKAVLVHAISEEAKRFYLKRGFVKSPANPRTLCLTLDSARRSIGRPPRAMPASDAG